MEGLLQDLLVDRPTALVNHLVDLGVQTCEDVQGLWQSGGALLDEFERHHGTVAAEEGFTIVSFWTLASQRAQASQRQKLKEICIHRQSAISTSAPSRPEASPPPVARPVRRLLEIGEVREPPILVNLAAKDPYVKEQAAKVAKTQTLFELLVQDFLNLEELGVSRSQLRDATRMQLLKESVMPAADRLSVHRLGALVSTLRRWRDFATRLGFDVQQPSPLQLNTFLKEVARGGPTAASSMFHALNWFRSQFGIPFPLDHWLVRSYKLLPVGHTSQQKLELQPWEFVNLILKLRQSSGTNTMVLAFLLWAAVSCIRFEHIQRSKFDRCEANALFFTCSQGKARRQGARPAFQWAMPEIPWPGFSLVKIIQDFVTMELLPGGTYLWPALQLDPLDLWQVTEHTPWKLDRKLSRGRFLELLRGALLDLGTASDQAQTAGFNRLRRFLPTLGNVFRLSPQDQQAVGNWVEIPTGGGPIPNQKSRATWTMGIHYSGQRALHSAQVKKALLKRFMRLYNAKKAELALTDDGLHPRDWRRWQPKMSSSVTLGLSSQHHHLWRAPLTFRRMPPRPAGQPMCGSCRCTWILGPSLSQKPPTMNQLRTHPLRLQALPPTCPMRLQIWRGPCRMMTWLCPRIGWCRAPRCTSSAARRMGGCSLGAEMPLSHRTLGLLERVSPPCPASVFASDAWLACPGGCTGHCRGTAGG